MDDGLAAALAAGDPRIRDLPRPHRDEHSLEMQLPFLTRVLPGVPIVPLVMGSQRRDIILELARALGESLAGEPVLLVASTDLSHYFDGPTAAALDAHVVGAMGRLDPDALLERFERYPAEERGRYVACGGGAAIAVMFAARDLGARDAEVLRYADSGDVSGDKSAVVGYAAAVMGRFRS